MKLPKTVIIAGKEWEIVQDPTTSGGWLDTGTLIIIIGTKST